MEENKEKEAGRGGGGGGGEGAGKGEEEGLEVVIEDAWPEWHPYYLARGSRLLEVRACNALWNCPTSTA